jgi:DNA-binding Lrp family transcriptional regulator
MKETDWKMIACLRRDGRETLTKISRQTDIPISTLYDKLKSEKMNLIKKHTCLLDFSQMGFNTRASVSIKLGKESKEEAKEYLLKHMNVNSLYKINNGYDFMIEVVFRHLKELEEFMEKMEERFEVLEYKVYYIIDDLKREEFLSNPEHIKLVL